MAAFLSEDLFLDVVVYCAIVWLVRPSWVLPRVCFHPVLCLPSSRPYLYFILFVATIVMAGMGQWALSDFARPALVTTITIALAWAYLYDLGRHFQRWLDRLREQATPTAPARAPASWQSGASRSPLPQSTAAVPPDYF